MNRRELLKSVPAFVAAGSMSGATGAKLARFRTAICAYSFRNELKSKKMTYDDLVRLAVELDIDGLDLTVYWFPNTSDSFLLPLRRLAYRNGVDIYSISVRTDMCQPTPEKQAREIEKVKKWVDVADKLSAGHIRVFGGHVPDGVTDERAAGWVVEVLKRAAEYAGSKGIILGLENHGGITMHASRIVEIVKKINSPWVGINLDTGNFREKPYEQIEMCLPYAVNSQFKTLMEFAGGRKEPSDWDRIVRLFAAAGYKGYLALEYEGAEPAPTAFPKYIKQLNALARQYTVHP